MKTFKTYEPPCVEVISIETPSVLCGSDVNGTGAKAMGATGNNSAIVI